MSDRKVKSNERRFRRGALFLFFISALSAASTSAMYHGFDLPILYSTSLAIPVVADIALRTLFAGWVWLKFRYYWFLGSLALAATLGLTALFSATISFSGKAFRGSFAGKRVGKLFSAFGVAQLVSARALYALGLVLYLLDVGVSVGLVLASPQIFTPYYLFLLGNLLLHMISLGILSFCFAARLGGAPASTSAPQEQHGDRAE